MGQSPHAPLSENFKNELCEINDDVTWLELINWSDL